LNSGPTPEFKPLVPGLFLILSLMSILPSLPLSLSDKVLLCSSAWPSTYNLPALASQCWDYKYCLPPRPSISLMGFSVMLVFLCVVSSSIFFLVVLRASHLLGRHSTLNILAVCVGIFFFLFCFVTVLGLELRAYTSSHFTSPSFCDGFFSR
jgi:hypothetical protein